MKKSRESSHYFSRQYPRRRQIRLPARLQISGTMTMPHGSSRWEHTMGAALCSGHGRRRLHSRQRQSPRSAGETSRAVFSSAPIAVFLIQKEKILEIVLFPFIGTQPVTPMRGSGGIRSLILFAVLCRARNDLAERREQLRLFLIRLHGTVHCADVPVNDATDWLELREYFTSRSPISIRWMNSRSSSGVSSSIVVYRLAFSMNASTLASRDLSCASRSSFFGISSSSSRCSSV